MSCSKTYIQASFLALSRSLPAGVQLLCVSKYHPSSAVLAAYEAGARCFGESRVQELVEKAQTLPKDIRWHFIGHLQTNKIRKLLPFVSLIHGVDSWHLLEKIDKVASEEASVVNVLLEVKISHDEAKSGFSVPQLLEMLHGTDWHNLRNVRICGLMGIATNTDDTFLVRQEFSLLHSLFEMLKRDFFADDSDFTILSMGMTHDWEIAVEEGSTMIRIGSGIFGEREIT